MLKYEFDEGKVLKYEFAECNVLKYVKYLSTISMSACLNYSVALSGSEQYWIEMIIN